MNLSRLLRSLGFSLALSVTVVLAAVRANAQDGPPQRPRITGISHVGFFVTNLPATISFWHDFLGFDEAYDLKKKDSDQVRIAFIKINDHQHIEFFNEPSTVPHDMLSHICFSVENIEQMRAYLRSKGFAVKPGNGGKTRTGDYAFEIKDPAGLLVEFVQSLPTGMEAQAQGKFMSDQRISTKIYHVGFLVGDSQRALDFYGKVLGFKETWRGGANPKELSWINMRVPDGNDYVEFMLYGKLPPPDKWGTKNHISLEVPDVAKAVEILKSRPAFKTYGRPLTIATGINGKRQVNLYDPDGTRIELMEPRTVTGKPVPSSTAPPPPPSHD